MAKHRYTNEEAAAASALLTQEELEEYKSLLLGGAQVTANKQRLDKLESIAYSRLKEKNNG